MQSGKLTVTGKGSTQILLLGRPHRVEVHFAGTDPVPVPCNPHHHHHDHLTHVVVPVDEDQRHHHDPVHHHHDRQFYLFISWEVSGIREIYWLVIY